MVDPNVIRREIVYSPVTPIRNDEEEDDNVLNLLISKNDHSLMSCDEEEEEEKEKTDQPKRFQSKIFSHDHHQKTRPKKIKPPPPAKATESDSTTKKKHRLPASSILLKRNTSENFRREVTPSKLKRVKTSSISYSPPQNDDRTIDGTKPSDKTHHQDDLPHCITSSSSGADKPTKEVCSNDPPPPSTDGVVKEKTQLDDHHQERSVVGTSRCFSRYNFASAADSGNNNNNNNSSRSSWHNNNNWRRPPPSSREPSYYRPNRHQFHQDASSSSSSRRFPYHSIRSSPLEHLYQPIYHQPRSRLIFNNILRTVFLCLVGDSYSITNCMTAITEDGCTPTTLESLLIHDLKGFESFDNIYLVGHESMSLWNSSVKNEFPSYVKSMFLDDRFSGTCGFCHSPRCTKWNVIVSGLQYVTQFSVKPLEH